jgi:hypothetical protein
VTERQASAHAGGPGHTGGPGRLARDRDRHETLHRGTGVVGASAPRFAGRTRKVTCARPVMDQHDLSVAPRAGGARATLWPPEAGGGPGHDDIGENS